MEKIQTLEGLESFRKKLTEVREDTSIDAEPTLLEQGLLLGRWERKCQVLAGENNELYKKGLPDRIEVSAEVATVLVTTEALFQKSEEAKHGRDKANMARTCYDYLETLLAPNPVSATKAGFQHFKTLWSVLKNDTALKRIRDAREEEVLGSYLLSEPQPGHYVLTRGKWVAASDDFAPIHPRGGRHQWYRAQIENVGIASNVDSEKLLPPDVDIKPSRGGGRGR